MYKHNRLHLIIVHYFKEVSLSRFWTQKIDTCAIENNPIFLDSVMYCRGAYNYDETLMILVELIQAYYE